MRVGPALAPGAAQHRWRQQAGRLCAGVVRRLRASYDGPLTHALLPPSQWLTVAVTVAVRLCCSLVLASSLTPPAGFRGGFGRGGERGRGDRGDRGGRGDRGCASQWQRLPPATAPDLRPTAHSCLAAAARAARPRRTRTRRGCRAPSWAASCSRRVSAAQTLQAGRSAEAAASGGAAGDGVAAGFACCCARPSAGAAGLAAAGRLTSVLGRLLTRCCRGRSSRWSRSTSSRCPSRSTRLWSTSWARR